MDLSVKTTWSSERRVDCIHTISGSYNHNLPSFFHSVKKGQELSNHSPFHFSSYIFSFWSDGVDFIYENDRRCILCCLFEYLSEPFLAFSVELPHYFWTCNVMKTCSRFICYGFCNQSFPSSWWTV